MTPFSTIQRYRAALLALSLGFLVSSAQAIPVLQLYIEGAVYDPADESWHADFSAGGTVRLWTIGNISGQGGNGTIRDVKLSAAYDITQTPTITVTPATTGGYGGFTDLSTPIPPTWHQTRTDGAIPKLWDGRDLPSHGEYGASTAWSEYLLGDFNVADSPGGDFITSFPTPGSANKFQINAYDITVTGADFVHFDLYNHVQARNKARAVFSPFSHDASGVPGVPDGGTTILLMAASLLGLQGIARKLRK